MTQLIIELTNNKEIRYDLFDSNPVVIKFIELVNSIKKVENEVAFPSYFMWTKRNFPIEIYVNSINESVEYFNKNNGYSHILKKVTHLSQDTLNSLHFDFEHAANIYLPEQLLSSDHNKSLEKKPPKCPDIGLLAFHLNNINSNVHILEASLGLSDRYTNAYFSIFLKDKTKQTPSIPLNDDDYNYFSLDTEFGDLMLGYGTTGKNIYHVYMNKDIHFFSDGNEVSPQNAITTNILGLFGTKKTHSNEIENLTNWLNETFPGRDFDLNNKKNSLGYIRLGTLVLPLELVGRNQFDIIEYYSNLKIVDYYII